MVEKLIKENMAKPQDQEAYAKRHSSLEKRHSFLVEKVTALEEERKRKIEQISALNIYLEEYKNSLILLMVLLVKRGKLV